MLEKILLHHDIKIVATDDNFTYNADAFLPSKVKHWVLKSETCLVESFNVKMRHYIPCLAHKTRAYVKSRESLNKVINFYA